jgi:uridine kinase
VKPFVVAITGVSGSGKTTLAKALVAALKGDRAQPLDAMLVPEDDYYRDSRNAPGFDAARYNFDDPASRDHALLADHLDAWARGEVVVRPRYDFLTHGRLDEGVACAPAPVIVLEGTHALCDPALAARCGLKVFVDTPPDIAFLRRLTRDIEERGRTLDSVVAQYLGTVRPSQIRWTLASATHADFVVSGGDGHEGRREDAIAAAVAAIVAAIRGRMQAGQDG